MTAFANDRDDPTQALIASPNLHYLTAVPGAPAGRGLFTDGALTQNSTTFTSATAAFTQADVGRLIRFVNNFAAIDSGGAIYINAVQSATSVTLNKAAGGSQTGRNCMVDRDMFFRSAFYGAVDPATGVYYCIANDNTSGGNRSVLFAIAYPGARAELLESYPSATPGEMVMWNGYLWSHQARRQLTTWA
ncbi:hypothetical protein [Rhodococcoides corynebacterioides]|uniref:hypothetical protein n=1 Tax=Rhodococcoides corynebacterioides TaxID=53972 RepID=UPI00082E6D79|nr:hypothetical protein [Rhodococcus corynebacterioides]